MIINSLKAVNFKNYSTVDVNFDKKFNCILGNNGLGKTNLLDAIYYLGIGKSHFRIPDINLVKRGESFLRLDAIFENGNQPELNVVMKVEPGKQKSIEKNGKKHKRLSDHVGSIPIVMIAPDDTSIGTGGSEERRRVIDETLGQTDRKYLESLIMYNKLIKQRNAALKMFAKNRSWDESLLESFDNQLIAPATYIYEQRVNWIEPITTFFQKHYEKISGGKEKPSIVYESTLREASIYELLKGSRKKDGILQRTTVGIHKDDLAFQINEMPVKKMASQGQLKSYVLALRLAQYSWLSEASGQLPILLLDDIFDKLDDNRVNYLIGLLAEKEFGQIFISDTSTLKLPTIFEASEISCKVFKVIGEGQID